ncbi:hypothetical protein ACMYYO_06135 [Dermacoccaceae bacterium W4C1]
MTNNTSGVSRRTLAKGAAWSVPTVAVASAAPAFASSPECQTCSYTNSIFPAPVTSQAIIVNNRGLFTLGGQFQVNVAGCNGLFNLALVRGTAAKLTMSDGSTYTSTVGLSAGPLVGPTASLGTGIAFSGVHFPDGTYTLFGAPVAPQSLELTFQVVLGLTGSGPVCQTHTVTYTPQLSAATGLVGLITHDGTVNYTGLWR